MITFKIGNKEYPIKILMKDAATLYPERFDIKLTSMFEGENLDNLLTRMFLGDDLALSLMTYYVEADLTYDQLLEVVTTSDVKNFKDAWWLALQDFFDPLRREFLKDLLAQAPGVIKKRLKESVQMLSNSGSSNSSEKQE